MKKRDWATHVKEVFAAIAAGGRFVPLGDNHEARQALAMRLAEIRRHAPFGGAPGRRPRRRAPGESLR